MARELTYRFGSRFMISCLGTGFPGGLLRRASRIAGRYSAILQHLEALQFDGIVDGGANIGEFALLARKALPEADLVCVEPQPDCCAILHRRGFRVVQRALWHSEAELQLVQVGESLASCALAAEGGPRPSWSVRTTRLDQIEVSGSRLLVKLDLQGAEPMALEGMGAQWSRCAGLLLEVSFGPGGTGRALSDTLAEHGFIEYSTVNELLVAGKVVEADKLWLRADVLEAL